MGVPAANSEIAATTPLGKTALASLLPEVDSSTLISASTARALQKATSSSSSLSSSATTPAEGASDLPSPSEPPSLSSLHDGGAGAAAAAAAERRRNRQYLESAPDDFGQPFAHRLRWAHAVNSLRRLHAALVSDAHLLEADVSFGPIAPSAASAALAGVTHRGDEDARLLQETSVRVASGDAVIMAHYPTERSSDLSMEHFVTTVLRHNELAAAAYARKQRSAAPPLLTTASSMQRSMEDASTDDEAAAFAAALDEELNATNKQPTNNLIPACVGARKRSDNGDFSSRKSARKGIKLDFKQWSAVEPTLAFLQKVRAAERLEGHLWLNADVFAGPGALVSPLDAQKFVRLCAELLPEAVLSLGWGSTILSTTRLYTHDMIERMIELCMCPIVRHSLPCRETKGASSSSLASARPEDSEEPSGKPGGLAAMGAGAGLGGEELYVAPAAACQHITFAVAAEYALASAPSLRRLLDYMPSASLTVYTGVGSLGVTPATVQELLRAFGKRRCFFDLRVTRPWRSWIFGPGNRSCSAYPLSDQPALPPGSAARSSCGPPLDAARGFPGGRAARPAGAAAPAAPAAATAGGRRDTGGELIAII